MLMKNKLLILIISLFLFNNLAFSKEFIFKTKNLEIIDNGKFIYGGKGTAITTDGDLEINANKFEYNKELDILKTFGEGQLIINSKNLEINYDNSVIDQKEERSRGGSCEVYFQVKWDAQNFHQTGPKQGRG